MIVRTLILITCFVSHALFSQVGIGTTNPQGALDVVSTNDTGLVIPRVSSIENVTDGSGGNPVNGTLVYDLSRGTTCFYSNNRWLCVGTDSGGNPVLSDETPPPYDSAGTYFKASNTEASDRFGIGVSMSNDGNTLVFGADQEDSNATGINGNESDNSSFNSGAVYVFYRNAGVWSQQAYIKASNTGSSDNFGTNVCLSGDGNTLVVGVRNEDSNATGINGDETNNSSGGSGAVYVFTRSGTVWTQQAYIKASNTGTGDGFGGDVYVSNDGNTLAVGANSEDSNATGINGDETNNSASGSGAAYIFTRSGSTWSQQAYIKASNTESLDLFGSSVALSGDGNTLAVGANQEDSNATGINGTESDNSTLGAGAVYVYTRSGSVWSQQAYVKASNTEATDLFGGSVSLDNTGDLLAVGAIGEDSNAIGVDGDESDNSASSSGAVYLFIRSGSIWSQQSYVKASNTESNDTFGGNVYVSDDGTAFAVGANGEASNAIGVNGDETNNSASSSGAAYVYFSSGSTWVKDAFVKPTNTEGSDVFARNVLLSSDGYIFSASSWREDSNATGIGGDETNNSAIDAGAGYLYEN